MAFKTLKLRPGVKTELTPSLLEAGIASSNLIRFRQGLPEKLGGWKLFFGNVYTTVQQMWAWADISFVNHLAVATDVQLTVITNNVGQVLTHNSLVTDPTIDFSTTAGSPIVTIVDPFVNSALYGAMNIETQISIDGLILYGAYNLTSVTTNKYTIKANSNAIAGVSHGGAGPVLTTVINSTSVNVLLNNHGYTAGVSIFAVAYKVVTVVGGILIAGLYVVTTVVDANNFTITSLVPATSSQTLAMNGGNARLEYYGIPSLVQDWSLGNWGGTLIACPQNGGIYEWDPASGSIGIALIPNAPTLTTGFFIAMPQQQIVAYGASVLGVQDPLQVAWCDVANFNVWTASTSNQAGTYRLTRGSKIIGGLQGPQVALLWTDVGVWLMQYIGYPLVYGFSEIAQGCGLASKSAAAVVGSNVYWMSLGYGDSDADDSGDGGFWIYSPGGAVQRLDCDVWDEIYQDINLNYTSSIRAAANTLFDEISWFFVSLSNGGTTNSKYVKYHTTTGEWDYGNMNVTAWIDANIFGPPLSAIVTTGLDGFIFQHETGPDAGSVAMNPSLTTGLFTLSEGEEFVFVDYMIPDFKYGLSGRPQTATLQVTFYAQDYPEATPTAFGPYTVTSSTTAISPRARGRYFSIEVSSDDLGSWWRMGGPKLRFAPDGRL